MKYLIATLLVVCLVVATTGTALGWAGGFNRHRIETDVGDRVVIVLPEGTHEDEWCLDFVHNRVKNVSKLIIDIVHCEVLDKGAFPGTTRSERLAMYQGQYGS